MDIKTIEDIRVLRPCYDPGKYLPEDWQGTALDILRVADCPAEDRLWVVLHDGWTTENQAREFACRCAERVLPIYEAEYPNDDRPRKAIETARAYMRGNVTIEQFWFAWDAAWDAAWAATGTATWAPAGAAARAVAWATAWDAAWASARDASRDAARATSWNAQIEIMIDILEGKHGY